MKAFYRTICAAGALAVLCGGALAENEMPVAADTPLATSAPLATDEPLATYTPFATDMPVVVDQPLTQAELDALEAQEQEQLAHAQQLLSNLGYLNGAADGIYGPRTASAIRDFQASRGLEQTGELDDTTLRALEDMAATAAESKEIQQRLIDLGYLRGKADGIFGERSQAALALFQTLEGLERTGKLDDATRALLFSNDAVTLPAGLSGGDKGDEVTELQEKLIQYGFLTGSADGSYGKKTVAAVKRFQQHLQAQGIDENLGVEATGEATPVTRMLLLDPEYSSYISDILPGMEGDEAARVERRLAQLGYMDAEPDEVFDDYAAQAAEAFQAAAGLNSGAFDRAFVDGLFAQDAPVAEHFVLHDIAYGDKGIAVEEIEEALLWGGMTIKMPRGVYNDSVKDAVERVHDYLVSIDSPQASLFEDPAYLKVGAQRLLENGALEFREESVGEMDEESVKRVQRRLHTLFYLSHFGVDGELGNGTVSALEAFQETNGLPVTGEVDTQTLRALFSKDAVCKRYPYRVEVDIDSQRVYVFQLNDAGDYEQVQTFICSTGLADATPRGIFLNAFPANIWHHFRSFKCWARYSFEIEGDIMFHSVLYDDKDPDTLRYGSVYALGSKASHGCIRLSVKDAKWLFENCKRGSLAVVIY